MQKLNFEALNNFCTAWLRKAALIDQEPLEGVFDRFFTLWVVYNRLYEEAGRYLVLQQNSANRAHKKHPRPRDKWAATDGIVTYVGKSTLEQHIFGNRSAVKGLDYIHDATQSGMFYFHENYETGEPDVARDLELVAKAGEGCVKSILTLIYQARCNLFHGQKSFSESQRDLLNGLNATLYPIILCTLQKIEEKSIT